MDGETILDFREVVTEYYIVSSDAKGGIRADDSVVMNKADTKPSLPDGGARGTRERVRKSKIRKNDTRAAGQIP